MILYHYYSSTDHSAATCTKMTNIDGIINTAVHEFTTDDIYDELKSPGHFTTTVEEEQEENTSV